MKFKYCTGCDLHKSRHNIVMGRGDLPATILFIGDSPSAAEDLLGVSSIGPTGKLLDNMRERAGIHDESTYFINTIFCRSVGEPTREQILACSQNVNGFISAQVCPQVVVLVGDTARSIFRRVFPRVVCITHPAVIMKKGGRNAPGFIDNVLKLQTIRRYL